MSEEALRALAALACLLAWVGFTLWMRARHARTARATDSDLPGAGLTWVIHASQTGQAELLAAQTAALLAAQGRATCRARLDEDWLTRAAGAAQLLFVVSTCGEGEAPESARMFEHMRMAGPCAGLAGMRYAVLALGDRNYPHFCSFGRRLDAWLTASGAHASFARIDADRLDAGAIAAWMQQLAPAVPPPAPQCNWSQWQFVERARLNPGSPGPGLYRVRLAPTDCLWPVWQAGDLIDLCPPSDPGHVRSYSIASVPQEGRLELIVRSRVTADGQPGAASGWLNAQARPGDCVPLRVRAHPGFRCAAAPVTPLILIGAGAGLGGLRAHLAAREAALDGARLAPPPRCAWLFFGERSAQHDHPCAAEFERWLQRGVLTKLERAFSRGEGACYVQDRLHTHAASVREWIAHDAIILICGGTAMARGVEAALHEILGSDGLACLRERGRLLRDVF